MRGSQLTTAILSLLTTALSTDNASKPLSRLLLPSNFKPPQVFKNVNLVHIVSLDKSYPKEAINVVIENVSDEPQDEYYLPFTSAQMERVGGLEAKDRKEPELGTFNVEAAEIDMERYIHLESSCAP